MVVCYSLTEFRFPLTRYLRLRWRGSESHRVTNLRIATVLASISRWTGQLKLKDWAFAIAKRSTMRKARVALARRLAIIMHAMLRDGTEFASA